MYTTRPSRYKRNRKHASACLRHDYRPNGMCVNCGTVHKRRARRFRLAQEVNQKLAEFGDQLTRGGQSLGEKVKGVFEKGN